MKTTEKGIATMILESIFEDIDRLSSSFKMESKSWDERQVIDNVIDNCKDMIYSEINKNLERVVGLLMSIRSDMGKGRRFYKEEDIELIRKNVIIAEEGIEVANVFILGVKELLQKSGVKNIQRSQSNRKWLDDMIAKLD